VQRVTGREIVKVDNAVLEPIDPVVRRTDCELGARKGDREAKIVIVAEYIVQFRCGIEEGLEQGAGRGVEQIGGTRVQRGSVVVARRNERAVAEQGHVLAEKVAAPRGGIKESLQQRAGGRVEQVG